MCIYRSLRKQWSNINLTACVVICMLQSLKTDVDEICIPEEPCVKGLATAVLLKQLCTASKLA